MHLDVSERRFGKHLSNLASFAGGLAGRGSWQREPMPEGSTRRRAQGALGEGELVGVAAPALGMKGFRPTPQVQEASSKLRLRVVPDGPRSRVEPPRHRSLFHQLLEDLPVL